MTKQTLFWGGMLLFLVGGGRGALLPDPWHSSRHCRIRPRGARPADLDRQSPKSARPSLAPLSPGRRLTFFLATSVDISAASEKRGREATRRREKGGL